MYWSKQVSKNKHVDRKIEILLTEFYVDAANKTSHFISSEQLECVSVFQSVVIVT